MSLVSAYINEDGRRVVHGTSKLKDSQAYPVPFGKAVYRLWARHRVELLSEAVERMDAFTASLNVEIEPVDLFGPLPPEALWDDANLRPVLCYLQTGRIPL